MCCSVVNCAALAIKVSYFSSVCRSLLCNVCVKYCISSVGAVGAEFSLQYHGHKSKSSTRFIGLVNAKPRPDRTHCCPCIGCFGGAINGRLERIWLCNNVKFTTIVYHQVQSSTVCIEGVWMVSGRCNRPEGIRARIYRSPAIYL
jgi:hypothetical protein